MAVSMIDRVFGHYPVSIATSLALEGLFHTGEYNSDRPAPYLKYDTLLLNVRTIFRNAWNAFEGKTDDVHYDVMRECVLQDIKTIQETVNAVSPTTICVPYLCKYKTLNKKYPNANFRNPNTPNQLHYNAVENDVYTKAEEMFEDLISFDTELSGETETLLLTHMPLDLLSYKKFPRMALLESHTGKVKTRVEWASKLQNKPKGIPFYRCTLQMFGDGVMFGPQELKVRRVLLKTAEKYTWSATTTTEKMFENLRMANEPHLLTFLRKLEKE